MTKNKEAEFRIATILAIYPWLIIILSVLLICVKDMVKPKVDAIDNDIIVSTGVVRTFKVVDSTRNGFHVSYGTTRPVSSGRLLEIQSRTHLQENFKKLQREAPIHFGSLVETDIYEFADFAIQYDCDKNVELKTIFVYGEQKTAMYVRPNPSLPNFARWIDPSTRQGVQYLLKNDIYYRKHNGEKIYRYWQCFGVRAISSIDERFAHFSEEERVY